MGPLKGMRIVEMAAIGPVPFAGMVLSDLGADVVRIDRLAKARGRDLALFDEDETDVTARGRRSVALDLKASAGRDAALALTGNADAVIEGFRPGVMERLGLGPQVCLERNPRLVFARMTGWGQSGPLANAAGHDINYIALTGVLHAIGPNDKPIAPLNLIGDYAGALGLVTGVLAAVIEARRSGKGQVVDCAMTEVASLLMARIWGLKAKGAWKDEREANILDGGAHFYGCYRCADGKWISIASIEAPFYAELIAKAGLPPDDFADQWAGARWPELKKRLEGIFAQRTRAEWCRLLEGSDVCFAPVLGIEEAPSHPHNRAREAFIEVAGVVQPAPAPRFSRTPADAPRAPRYAGVDSNEVLAEWGFSAAEIARLKSQGAA
ncbi:MAG: CoA transferase [Hyphomicrobiaceae bacterium]|nr:MAG: CoA transferase [Hyphomicrobiaceae bacterium]